MPLTKKGRKILREMKAFYNKTKNDPKLGEKVFYASIADGKVTGAEVKTKRRKKK